MMEEKLGSWFCSCGLMEVGVWREGSLTCDAWTPGEVLEIFAVSIMFLVKPAEEDTSAFLSPCIRAALQ